jgi:hypothetical protein
MQWGLTLLSIVSERAAVLGSGAAEAGEGDGAQLFEAGAKAGGSAIEGGGFAGPALNVLVGWTKVGD